MAEPRDKSIPTLQDGETMADYWNHDENDEEGDENNLEYSFLFIKRSSDQNPPQKNMKSQQKSPNFQVFIQSPDLNFRIQSIIISDPNSTISDLKNSIFPKLFPKLNQATLTLALAQITSSLYFTLNGKLLSDSDTLLRNTQIAPLSTLNLHYRLVGGGGDGGATGAESRDCYLNMYAVKKPDKVDPHEQKLSKWLNCSLSNEPLKHPIVIDGLGNLFNKEAIVEALLKKRVPKGFGYIKGLKDLNSVELSGDGGRFMCPITGLEFNGRYRFVAIRTCGHVLSTKAFKEVKSSECLVCRKEYTESDKIAINGNEEEVMALRERLEVGRAKANDGRKVKRKKGNGGGEEGVEVERLSGKKREMEKVMKKVSDVNGKIEVKNVGSGLGNGPVKKFKAVDAAPAHANKEVYASIFTSSSKSDFKETYSCRSLPFGRN